MFSKTLFLGITRRTTCLCLKIFRNFISERPRQSPNKSVSIIHAEVNVYVTFWTNFPLNKRQPSKALKSNRRPSKLEKLTVSRQSHRHPIDTLKFVRSLYLFTLQLSKLISSESEESLQRTDRSIRQVFNHLTAIPCKKYYNLFHGHHLKDIYMYIF